jgi:two-component system, cell cycle response regulator CtrA
MGKLEDDNASLRERVRQLEKMLGGGWRAPRAMRLSPQEEQILGILVAKSFVAYPTLVDWLYSEQADGGPEDPRNVITTTVSRIKSKLRPYGYDIDTSWGRGYSMSEWMRKELRDWSEQELETNQAGKISRSPA